MNEYENIFEQKPFGTDNFAENPEPRCPLLLLLDASGSMGGIPITELNAGIATLKEELEKDELASKRVELAIVTFGPVEMVQDFTTVSGFDPPPIKARGDTPMGAAINQGLDLLESRKSIYRQNGIAYYRPWVMLITDGARTDHWQQAAERVKQGEVAKSFAFFVVGVQNADIDILSKIAVRQPLKLKGLQFREYFLWLSNSMQTVSQSAVGDKMVIPSPGGPSGWAEI